MYRIIQYLFLIQLMHSCTPSDAPETIVIEPYCPNEIDNCFEINNSWSLDIVRQSGTQLSKNVDGYFLSSLYNKENFHVLLFDSINNIVWNNTISELQGYFGEKSIFDDLGNIYLLANNTSKGSKIVKLNMDGNLIWEYSHHKILNSILIDDTRLYAGGSNNSPNSPPLIIELKLNGDFVHSFLYGSEDTEIIYDIQKLNDEIIFIGKTANQTSPNGFTYFHYNNDTSGISSNRKFLLEDFLSIPIVQPTIDNGFSMLTHIDKDDVDSNLRLFKFDSNSQVTANFSFGGMKFEAAIILTESNDKGLLIGGNTGSFGNGQSDIYIIKIDESGNVLWSNTYGNQTSDGLIGLEEKLNGNLFLLGSSESTNKIFAVELDNMGNPI